MPGMVPGPGSKHPASPLLERWRASAPARTPSAPPPPRPSVPPPDPAALLRDLEAILAAAPPPALAAAVSVLLEPIRQAVAAPPADPAKLLPVFEQVEDLLEALFLVGAPAPQ